MTLGFFSPMPPARTGVADYSAALLAAMREQGTVRVGDGKAAASLYHLGNNRLHADIYRRAMEHPGLVVLHDAVLHHFYLGLLEEENYVAEFVYNYGRWNEGLARRLWRNRARSGSDPIYFQYPMLKRVADTARAVVVHNPAAARAVREHNPGAHIHEIPHLYAPAPEPAPSEVLRLRAELGVAPSDCLFGIFGHLRESKRIMPVLRVFERLRAEGERTALLVAGEFVSTDLERAVCGLLNRPGILRVGYTPESTFWLYAHAVDACINLRYPAAGETSGIAVRLMGISKPVLMTAGAETESLPPAAAIRIDAGLAEEDMLFEAMLWMTRFAHDREAIGRAAASHIAAHHNPRRVAELYWNAVREACA